ncbi:transposable element Tcb1 transposase [Trichonephila clavipes]|nr:transposable element Tcb1 transposase [Trichonephila clavipes]
MVFIVFEEGFHQPIKRSKQSVFLDVMVFRHTLLWISFTPNVAVLFVDVAIQPELLIKYPILDRGRIVAYRDCGLPFRQIESRVGRNQTTVEPICDCWMQEGTTDQRGRSHLPQCTTSREDKQIVRMAVMNLSVTSRTLAQHIETVTHHSMYERTFQRRLQPSDLSARRTLLGQPLTENQICLWHQWCDERRITPLVCIAGTLNSQRYISEVLEPVDFPYLQGFATVIFQQLNALTHVARIVQRFFVNYQIELLPWPARSPDLSPIETCGPWLLND